MTISQLVMKPNRHTKVTTVACDDLDSIMRVYQEHPKLAKSELKTAMLLLVNKGIPDYHKLDVRNDDQLKGYTQAIAEIKENIEEFFK